MAEAWLLTIAHRRLLQGNPSVQISRAHGNAVSDKDIPPHGGAVLSPDSIASFVITSVTGPNLALGVVLTAMFDLYFPREILDLVFLGNRALSVLFAAGLSVPVYYCGGGTVPLIRAWMDTGMSLGEAASFMMIGPPTKFTNLAAVRTITSRRGFACYIVYSVAFGVVAGLLLDALTA